MSLGAVLLAVVPLYYIYVAPPRYSLIPPTRAGELVAMCGSDARGCTRIRGSSLRADCVGDGDHWHPSLQISFVPYVYIGDWSFRDEIAAHEREHLLDLRDAAESFAWKASRIDYGSRDRCVGDAARLQIALDGTLTDAAAASFARIR